MYLTKTKLPLNLQDQIPNRFFHLTTEKIKPQKIRGISKMKIKNTE